MTIRGAGIYGGNVAWGCGECGSLVLQPDMGLHSDWHEQQKRIAGRLLVLEGKVHDMDQLGPADRIGG